jgi:hypothetical protein
MRRVVGEAIEFKADPDRAPSRYLLRRREPGARCPGRCSGEVEKITVSGRAGYYCPRCQTRDGRAGGRPCGGRGACGRRPGPVAAIFVYALVEALLSPEQHIR